MGFLFYFSNLPGSALRWYPKGYGLDKVFHAFAYGLLALSCLFAFNPHLSKIRTLWANIAILLFCLVYGITEELHQSFIPGRVVSGWDVLAGMTGSLIVIGILSIRKMTAHE
jgi:VanZ family protein